MNGHQWHCRYFSLAECGLATDTSFEAVATTWLSPAEHHTLVRLQSPHRRREWLAGRVAAKRLLSACGWTKGASPQQITIDSRRVGGQGGAPEVFIQGINARVSLSVSHLDRGVLVALSEAENVRVGVDLVHEQQVGTGFRRMWFTEAEQAWVRRKAADHSAVRLWAAKESVFKVLPRGRSFSPRQIEIRPLTDGRWTCRVDGRDLKGECHIYNWRVDGMTACLAVRRVSHTE